MKTNLHLFADVSEFLVNQCQMEIQIQVHIYMQAAGISFMLERKMSFQPSPQYSRLMLEPG
jgi:hypothetical protein